MSDQLAEATFTFNADASLFDRQVSQVEARADALQAKIDSMSEKSQAGAPGDQEIKFAGIDFADKAEQAERAVKSMKDTFHGEVFSPLRDGAAAADAAIDRNVASVGQLNTAARILGATVGMSSGQMRVMHAVMLAMNSGGGTVSGLWNRMTDGVKGLMSAFAGLGPYGLAAGGILAAAGAVALAAWKAVRSEIEKAKQDGIEAQAAISALNQTIRSERSIEKGSDPTTGRLSAAKEELAKAEEELRKKREGTTAKDEAGNEVAVPGLNELENRLAKAQQDLKSAGMGATGDDAAAAWAQEKAAKRRIAELEPEIEVMRKETAEIEKRVKNAQALVEAMKGTAEAQSKYESEVSKREAAMTPEQRQSEEWLREKAKLYGAVVEAAKKEGEALKENSDVQRAVADIIKNQADLNDAVTAKETDRAEYLKRLQRDAELSGIDDPYEIQRRQKDNEAAERREQLNKKTLDGSKERAEGEAAIEKWLADEKTKINAKEDEESRSRTEDAMKKRRREEQEEIREEEAKAEKKKRFLRDAERDISDAVNEASMAKWNEIEARYRERVDEAAGDAEEIKAAEDARLAQHERQLRDIDEQVEQAKSRPIRFMGIEQAWSDITQMANTRNLEQEKLKLMQEQRDTLAKMLDELKKGSPPSGVV